MKVKVFDNEESLYFNWIKNNQEGYVLNTTKIQPSKYYMIHKANCFHISGNTKKYRKGAFTNFEWIKVCSNDQAEIKYFIAEAIKTQSILKNCKTCKPLDSDNKIESNTTISDKKLKIIVDGKVRVTTVKTYERNPVARSKCIEHHGCKCKICGFDFEKTYGEIGHNYIHVHHLEQLSNLKKPKKINYKKDLKPVCPNCHAMIHINRKEPRTIEEIKNMINNNRS